MLSDGVFSLFSLTYLVLLLTASFGLVLVHVWVLLHCALECFNTFLFCDGKYHCYSHIFMLLWCLRPVELNN